MFRNYFAEQEDLFVQLEKKKICDIHKEISGHDLVEAAPKKKEMIHTDPESAIRELEQFRAKAIQSVHLDDELASLKNGKPIDVTDTFRINTFKRTTHNLYPNCRDMRIEPVEKVFSLDVDFTGIRNDAALTSDLIFRVKQDLYDMMQSIISEDWLKPFTEFFDELSVSCCRIKPDSFDLPQRVPFMKVEIPVDELRIREGKFYSVADLHTIATITMLE